jgi:hypothetical protein
MGTKWMDRHDLLHVLKKNPHFKVSNV